MPSKLALGLSNELNADTVAKNRTRAARMAAVLLAERAKRAGSFWAPYIDFLSAMDTPSLNRFEPFLHGQALSVAQAAQVELREDISNLVEGGVDSAAARWALGLVSTRSFKVSPVRVGYPELAPNPLA